MKSKNPQDATGRNIKASHKRDDALKRRVMILERRLDEHERELAAIKKILKFKRQKGELTDG